MLHNMEMIMGFGPTILPTQSNKIKWEKEREKANKDDGFGVNGHFC
jgi:hypothetical protein